MSRSVSESPLGFEIMRVDCTILGVLTESSLVKNVVDAHYNKAL